MIDGPSPQPFEEELRKDQALQEVLERKYDQDHMLENPKLYEEALDIATKHGDPLKTGGVYNIILRTMDGLAVIDRQNPEAHIARAESYAFVEQQRKKLAMLFEPKSKNSSD